jgi:hypothetical protein
MSVTFSTPYWVVVTRVAMRRSLMGFARLARDRCSPHGEPTQKKLVLSEDNRKMAAKSVRLPEVAEE